ncbi:thymidylate synthase [Candidatus Parcubacteria bacterium]|nr:thymidylate synthase [Candidatus Parcubacteria bacterium]
MIPYLPYEKRTPDTQYRQLLTLIRDAGEEVETQQEHPARKWIGYLMRFPISNGFPLITERNLVAPPSQFRSAIAELCAFLNGAQTLDEMRGFGCGWWAQWVTPDKCAKRGLEPGDLGPGSYGPAWRRFPTSEGVPFDQIMTLLEQIEELPHLRTLRVTNWIPQYIPRGKGRQQKVVVVPCHGDFHVHINTRTREMKLVHIQRSGDSPVGLVFNLIQYGALLLMLAQVTGYIPKELVYFVDDGHIFLKQMEAVEQLLATKPMPLPTVIVDPEVKNLFGFGPQHFHVSDYHPQNERMTIWTPV